MSNPYGDYEKKFGKPDGGGESQFLKTEDGNTYRLILLSDALHYLSEWEGNWNDRYAWIVFNTEEKKIQILSKGISVFKQVFELAIDEDWGYPQYEYDIKLKHKGTGKSTEYAVTPGKKLDDPEAMKKLLAEAEKIELKNILKGGVWITEENMGEKPKKIKKGEDGEAEEVREPDVVLDDISEDDPVDLGDIPF